MRRWMRLRAGVLACTLAGGMLATGARADAPVFADVPADHWARAYVEQAYAEGAVNGTAFDGVTRQYSPDGQLSLAQWLAICTRTWWPEEVAAQPVGEVWYGPNLAVAQKHGLLAGLEGTDLNGPLSRYDMAVVSVHVMSEENCRVPHLSEVVAALERTGDFDAIPEDRQVPALVMLASGIITGVDSAGSFAGTGTFTRAQAAAVYCRLSQAVACRNQRSIPLADTALRPDDPALLPVYTGEAYDYINRNIPYFTVSDLSTDSYETYGELDELGRCSTAWSNIGPELMPTEERGEIGMVKPTGWHTVTYDCIPDRYLYNRCHLIGYQLTGENDRVENLITGTRYLNIEGMLPLENEVADYIRQTGNHVLYRVTPMFRGEELVASGVLMEAYSVEDRGQGICYCLYAHNVQPGVVIDYATGDSWAEGGGPVPAPQPVVTPTPAPTPAPRPETVPTGKGIPPDQAGGQSYVLNTNTGKFHRPGCSQAGRIQTRNRHDYTGSREQLLEYGYEPCRVCDP